MHAVRLDPKIEQRLDKLARKSGSSKSTLVRNAIVGYLEDLEDSEEAVKRLKKPGRIWTLEELERGADLES